MILGAHRGPLWALLLAFGGCAGPYEPSPPASAERYAVELAAAYCAYGLRCESPADGARFSVYCHPSVPAPEIAELLERRPHLAFDAEAAVRCLATIEQATAGCGIPVCDPVLVGTLAAGEACDEEPECGPGLTCVTRGEGRRCSGICAPTATEGSRCSEDRECAEGLHCEDRRCAADRYEGDRCDRDRDCAAALRCERGRCLSPAEAEGWRCEPEEDDDGDVDEGIDEGADRCPIPTDCADGVCRRYEPEQVAGPGEACADRPCAASHFCQDDRCVARPVLTEPCGAEARCMEGRCVGGTCRLLPPRAECATDAECSTDRCTGGACEVPSAVGAPCDRDRDCANGLQCSGGSCVVRVPCG